ncbi:MAG: hypothetical protein HWQ43_15615 [Nostoc sp. JL31]|nr:hypothetical protein [Nostoc sp. JL31]MBN3890520.1 hypothetical protein [Nostoc sp. JL31]
MIPIVLALYTPVAHAITALRWLPLIPYLREGKQSAALAGLGSLGLIQ